TSARQVGMPKITAPMSSATAQPATELRGELTGGGGAGLAARSRAASAMAATMDSATRALGSAARRPSGTTTLVPQKRQATVVALPICSASDAPHDGHLNASPPDMASL